MTHVSFTLRDLTEHRVICKCGTKEFCVQDLLFPLSRLQYDGLTSGSIIYKPIVV